MTLWHHFIAFLLWPLTPSVCVFVGQMHGAGAKSWNRLSALFNQDDEHQLLEETESPPVADQWVQIFLSLWDVALLPLRLLWEIQIHETTKQGDKFTLMEGKLSCKRLRKSQRDVARRWFGARVGLSFMERLELPLTTNQIFYVFSRYAPLC